MLSANGLLESAKREAGLDDYGDMGFTEGLRVLIDSINTEAGLTPGNEAALEKELIRVLVNRLRMQRDLVLHPEILAEEILPPVFITSMPRTGSTKLHRLMAATRNFNAMTFWHSYHFGRIPGAENDNNAPGSTEPAEPPPEGARKSLGRPDAFPAPDPRIADAERYLQWLYQRAPGFQQYHPMYTEEAEEELSLLDAGFNSLYRYAVLLNVPSYVQWVLGRDGLQSFRDIRRMLQYLQWQHFRGQRRRWVLKTPSLFGLEDAFAQVFPGMDFIVTHRHPVDTLPSICGLFCGVRQLYNDQDMSQVVGAAALYNFGETLKGHLHWRQHYPAHKVLDLRFDDIMKDEIAVLGKIHAFLGMSFDETAKANVRAWIAMDAKRGHARATVTLAEYGVTPEAINDRLSSYIDHYAEFLSPAKHP